MTESQEVIPQEPDMVAKQEKIKQRIARQEAIFTEIQNVIKNHKKTGQERKTTNYFEKRLKQLQDLKTEHEQTNDWLQEIDIEYQTSDYFLKNQTVEVTNLVEPYINTFNQEIQALGALEVQTPPLSPMIQKLIRRQKVMISSLKRALSWVEAEDTETPSFKVKQKLWEEIQNIHFKLWESTDDPIELGYEMNVYTEVEAEMMSMLNTVPQARKDSAYPAQANSPHIPLPKVQIPKFDGDYGQWPTFHDLFLKVVHEQPIAAVQKMWFLKSNLTGEAESLIRHLSLTANNYETAWNLLKERFNNKRVVTSKLLQQIIDCQPVNSDATQIKVFHDTIRENLLALENVGISTKGWDPLLLHILVKKLDRYTHSLYESSIQNPKELQDVDNFLKFLEQRFQTLESLGPKEKKGAVTKATSASVNYTLCKICDSKDHAICYCKRFLDMNPKRRLQMAQNNKLCINCLKPGHGPKNCTSRPCKQCARKHNSLLHFDCATPSSPSLSNNRNSGSSTPSSSSSRSSNPANSTAAESSQSVLATSKTATPLKGAQSYVFLATAKVRIAASNGQTCEARAVLDAGSQVNLITQRLINKLSLSTTKAKLMIEGVGQHAENASARVNTELQSTTGEFSTRFEAFVMPKIISPQPSMNLDITTWNIPEDVALADQDFHKSGKIDILIGAEHYHHLMQPQQLSLGTCLPLLQNTVLGWIVVGKTRVDSKPAATCAIFASTEEKRISEIMERFWTTEELQPEEEYVTANDKICEQHFANTTSRSGDGKFVVRLPFAETPSLLGNSQMQAEKRFLAIEKKLARDPDVKKEYKRFMEEYEALGHMQKIDKRSIPASNYFIPHHCVLKPDSTTTKLRVVFDASAKTSSGKSLNDLLHKGPTVQSELFSILLRFRIHKYVFTADIEKMYRQVLIHPDDQSFQLIVWRTQESEPYQYYKLNTVTYGTTSAPYLATKCLQHLATQNKAKYPLGSAVILKDCYVDDCLSGANNITIAQYKQAQSAALLLEAGFNLRKWCANDPRLLANVPMEDRELNLSLDGPESIKTLGVIWRPKTDELCGRANVSPATKLTKRTISSDLARIFDPLGIFGPVTVTAKMFMQQLWELKIDWDEEIPDEMKHQWLRFKDELPEINNLTIQRHVFGGRVPTSVQIHTFVDASERAFGAAVYIRATNPSKVISVRLLCAKSRIAPLKRLTIPRLELCAAMLGAELTARVRSDLDYTDTPTFYWSDSEIVLSWIQSSSANLHTFVANRIAKIQSLSEPTQWRHVSSNENPADILSRGIQPRKLGSCSQWFYGPMFLHRGDESWLQPGPHIPEFANDVERRTKRAVTIVQQCNEAETMIQRIEHRNSFKFLQNTVGYLRRPFISPKPQHMSLSPSELRQALLIIVRAIQSSAFKIEINDLKAQRAVAHTSPLSALTPFIDPDGIVRVGGRVAEAAIQYDAKHPMVLPYNDSIVKLLFQLKHVENKHCGGQSLLAAMKQSFWPIKGKITARNVVHNCVVCSRAKPKLFGQIMGNLPKDRVTITRPFLNAGVDYCGPFSIHHRAVHLELVTDLTTKSFLGALSRFIGRRGRCKTIYCDNATNFVGAKNYLEELRETLFSKEAQETVIRESSNKGIEFKFIPPRGPHFGGLWEAAVKSAKHLLTRDVSSANLTYEELETVIVGIEAILNSRPLTPMSSDPNDFAALTPGHFLIGEPLTAIAELADDTLKATLVQRWELVAKLKYEFWRRWSSEYLTELQYRHKWQVASKNVQPGDMVIMKDDNLPVMEWKIGKIERVHRGDDGRVRVIDVKTSKGVYKRLIHSLAPLPTDSSLNAQDDQIKDTTSTTQPLPSLTTNSREHALSTNRQPLFDRPKKRQRICHET